MRQRWEDSYKFEVSLVYIVSARLARATETGTVSKDTFLVCVGGYVCVSLKLTIQVPRTVSMFLFFTLFHLL